MSQENSRSHYVPGELRLKSLLLVVAFFLALDFTAYWCAAVLFRNLPQQKPQETHVGSKAIEFEKRLAVLEQSTNALTGQVATAKEKVSAVEQKVTDLKKTMALLEEARRQERASRKKPSNSR